MKRKLIALALAAVVFVLAEGGSGPLPRGGPGAVQGTAHSGAPDGLSKGGESTLAIRLSGDPQTLNPDLAGDDYAYPVAQNVFGRLCKLDSAKEVIPDLAQSWDISEDGRTITFHLRRGVYWHDGQPFDAGDVVYTFETIKANPTYFLSANLQGVESFERKDDYTVVFHMAEPNAAIIGALAWYGSFILPEHLYAGAGWEQNPYNLRPVGTGPFRFEAFRPGEAVTLVKNEDYWQAEPAVDRLEFRVIPSDADAVEALTRGGIDVMEGVPAEAVPALRENLNIRLAPNEYPSPVYIAFNVTRAPSSDRAVRTAVALCVDREAIAETVYDGLRRPEYAFYPSLSWASNQTDTAPGFDPRAASELLEQSGYAKNSEGFYLSLTLDCFESGGFADVARHIAAGCRAAGIDLRVSVMEYGEWSQKVLAGRDFDAEIQGGFQGPDPAALASRAGTGGSMNLSGYSRVEVDNLFAEAAGTGDRARRAALYQQAQALLADDLPIVPVVGYTSVDAYRASIRNAPIDGAGRWGWQEYTFAEFAE